MESIDVIKIDETKYDCYLIYTPKDKGRKVLMAQQAGQKQIALPVMKCLLSEHHQLFQSV